jgi:hypothetical protein
MRLIASWNRCDMRVCELVGSSSPTEIHLSRIHLGLAQDNITRSEKSTPLLD